MPDLKPDVVRLILSDHESFRARFAELATLRAEPQAAAALWTGLAADLERHASAEEAHFYPALLKDVDDSEDETSLPWTAADDASAATELSVARRTMDP